MKVLQHCNDCGFKWSITGIDPGEGFDTCPSCDSENVEEDE